ncbi:MAG: DUF2752 domain-containing protein [bacterium]|nr:DUF2752 domain-containing protein [bacterium]
MSAETLETHPPQRTDRPFEPADEPFPWYLRVILIFAGSLPIALLATALMLRPDANGFGTHQQLGLPPCSFGDLVGVNCPSCGMTTSWAYTMRFNLWGAVQSNAGGAMLACLCLALGPWLFLSGVKGDWFLSPPNEAVFVILGLGVVVVTLIDWVLRNFVFS